MCKGSGSGGEAEDVDAVDAAGRYGQMRRDGGDVESPSVSPSWLWMDVVVVLTNRKRM